MSVSGYTTAHLIPVNRNAGDLLRLLLLCYEYDNSIPISLNGGMTPELSSLPIMSPISDVRLYGSTTSVFLTQAD